MLTITVEALKKHFDHYIEIGQAESIKVTNNGKTIFTIIPEYDSLTAEASSYFDMLPAGITIDPEGRKF